MLLLQASGSKPEWRSQGSFARLELQGSRVDELTRRCPVLHVMTTVPLRDGSTSYRDLYAEGLATCLNGFISQR